MIAGGKLTDLMLRYRINQTQPHHGSALTEQTNRTPEPEWVGKRRGMRSRKVWGEGDREAGYLHKCIEVRGLSRRVKGFSFVKRLEKEEEVSRLSDSIGKCRESFPSSTKSITCKEGITYDSFYCSSL